jgi:hypothetical protein
MTTTATPVPALIVGRTYVGDASTGDLMDMEFRLVYPLGAVEYDMADDATGFYTATVEVGSEVWADVLLPADATATEQPAAFLTHRTHPLGEAARRLCAADEDRAVVAGEVPTCGDCRAAFIAGYCPGFNLYDAEVTNGSDTVSIRVAADNGDNAAYSARWIVSQRHGWENRDAAAGTVRFVSTNPAADTWKAENA